MTGVRLTLLGEVSVWVDGGRLGLAQTPPTKALAALCYLAVTRAPASRRRLVEMLWPASAGDDQSANLRVALAQLRRAMPGVIEADRERIVLAPSVDVELDTETFTSLVNRGTIDDFERAAELYAGDFMASIDVDDAPAFEEWVAAERERLRLLARGCLEALADHHAARGDLVLATEHALALTRMEPWREAAQRRLMLLHAWSGDHALALQQYRTCVTLLAEELGVEPSAATTRLAERIDAARKAPPYDAPRPVTPLVGRDKELADLSALLLQPETRLVSLVGVGGIGKTRLALGVTERLRHRFLEGVRFLDLAEVDSRGALIEQLHAALAAGSTEDEPSRDEPWQDDRVRGASADDAGSARLLASLCRKLRGTEMLLTLDNLEQLVDAAAAVLSEIMTAAPDVTLLVTSRTRLRLQAEWVVQVHGLDYPDAELPGATASDAELTDAAEPDAATASAARSSAVQLFEQAHRRAGGSHALDSTREFGRRAAVLRVCRLVDGHPLALQLAGANAARSSALEVAEALAAGLGPLASDARDAPAGKVSIEAVLEQSRSRLDEPAREMFERLSVFSGSFDLEAAGEVAKVPHAVLEHLVDRSLLQRSEERYSLHPLVRGFARGRLSAQARDEVLRRHAEHFLERCRDMLRHFWSAEKASYLKRLSLDQDNLRAALQWSLGNDSAIALGLARRLWQVWMAWGQLSEGRRWLEAALVVAPSVGNASDHVSALNGLASLAYLQGDIEEARRRYEESLELLAGTGDESHLAIVLNNLGSLLRSAGDLAGAAHRLEESLAIRRRLGDAVGIASTLSNQGLLAEKQGDLQAAFELYGESLELRRANDDLSGVANALCNLGFVSIKLGRPGEAANHLLEALTIEHGLGGVTGAAYCVLGLGNVEFAAGRWDEAARWWGAAAALRAASGSSMGDFAAEHEKDVAAARSFADPVTFERAWAQGAELELDQAVARARERFGA